MSTIAKGVRGDAKAELRRAVSNWVRSLPDSEARQPSILVDGTSYSPVQILQEIQRETEFGREFIEELYEVDRRLGGAKRGSVLALIRASMI